MRESDPRGKPFNDNLSRPGMSGDNLANRYCGSYHVLKARRRSARRAAYGSAIGRKIVSGERNPDVECFVVRTYTASPNEVADHMPLRSRAEWAFAEAIESAARPFFCGVFELRASFSEIRCRPGHRLRERILRINCALANCVSNISF